MSHSCSPCPLFSALLSLFLSFCVVIFSPQSSKKTPVTKTATKTAKTATKPAAKDAKDAKKAKRMNGTEWKAAHSHLFANNVNRKQVLGQGITPKMDLTHFVKWPLYVRIQRQRAVLKARIRVPAAINQFRKTLTKDQAATLFQLLGKYRPETDVQKTQRLKAVAAAQAKDQKVEATPKPKNIKFGLKRHHAHRVQEGVPRRHRPRR